MSLEDSGPPAPLTPQDDAEDLALVLRGAREAQGVSVAELARRAGVPPSEVLAFESAKVVPPKPPFAVYMCALGYET